MTHTGPVVVAFGGGTNSTAMVTRMVAAGERIDALLFADTGGELPETYAHIDAVSAWLVARGYPAIITVGYTRRDGTPETLEGRCLSQNMLPSLAYGFKKCSMRFKQDPQHKWLRSWQPAVDAWARGEKVLKVIGIDADEPRRVVHARSKRNEGKRMAALVAAGMKKSAKAINSRLVNDWNQYEYRYPLLDEWDMGRAECVETIRSAGLALPGKSSCFFCPAAKPAEIISLAKTHPDYLERALAIEANAVSNAGHEPKLGRWRSWRAVIAQWRAQGELFPDATPDTDMPCGCFDG